MDLSLLTALILQCLTNLLLYFYDISALGGNSFQQQDIFSRNISDLEFRFRTVYDTSAKIMRFRHHLLLSRHLLNASTRITHKLSDAVEAITMFKLRTTAN
jgi:hypothetical protein